MDAPSPDDVVFGFPGFEINPAPTDLAYLSFGDPFLHAAAGRFENGSALFYQGLQGSGPLLLFDKSSNTLVIGPADAFATTVMWQDGQNYVYWGITGSVTQLPADFTYNVLLYGREGAIGSALEEWGMVIRSDLMKLSDSYGPPGLTSADTGILNTLGYWTGPSSAYYNAPEMNKTYEETLMDVKQYTSNESDGQSRIPYGYVEVDTWWYEKGVGGFAKTWKAPADVFPDGIGGLADKIKWPIVAAGGQWSTDNTYATQNGGNYTFVIGDTCALPNDQNFWNDLFAEAKANGVRAYIQYNMAEQYKCMGAQIASDGKLIPNWLLHLNSSAAANDLDLIYSGAIPRLVMEAAFAIRQPFVVQVGSGQFSDASHWKVGVANIFANAMELRPFFGGIKSQKNDSGDPATQLPPLLYSLLVTISGGPVAYGDKIGESERQLIDSRCCMSNGTVLGPLRPARAIDAQLQQMAWGGVEGATGEVWTAFTGNRLGSANDNNFFNGIIMAAAMTAPFNITPSAAGFNFSVAASDVTLYQPGKIFSWHDPNKLYDFADDKPFTLQNCTLEDFCIYHVAPVVKFKGKDVVIMGDLRKWVPMSTQRIDSIEVTAAKIVIKTKGVTDEKVYMWLHVDEKLQAMEHMVGDDGFGYLIYEEGGASPSSARQICCANYVIILCALIGFFSRLL
nr:hypothetical protein BaRGS_016224 [Batillaria attramentaria]